MSGAKENSLNTESISLDNQDHRTESALCFDEFTEQWVLAEKIMERDESVLKG